LAYMSIQLGSVTSFDAASPFIVGSSFALATGQFGLLLVPVSVLDPLCQQRRRDSPCQVTADHATDLRHWFLAFALFALCAAIVNWAEAAQRRRADLQMVFPTLHSAQRIDALVAVAASFISMIFWGVSFRVGWFAIFFGGILATLFAAFGIHHQSVGRRALESDLRSIAQSTFGHEGRLDLRASSRVRNGVCEPDATARPLDPGARVDEPVEPEVQ
jgi:hypothetical protein